MENGKLRNILAFGASNSSKSINKQLAWYAANRIKDARVNLIDLNNYEMPIFSVDREESNGIPQLAYDFKDLLKNTDGIVISFAEHNGAYSVAFKNVLDWISRIKGPVWEDKPMLLLATSPGKRGAKTVLDIAVNKFSFMNSNTIVHFSLPSFKDNFSKEIGITDFSLKQAFDKQLDAFVNSL
jgi:NAD(P)H-dependent FMN reductase